MKTIPSHEKNYTKGRTVKVDRIVLHYTAGDGDTAENNGKYFQSLRGVSAHYFVDKKEVVESVNPANTAWHAGDWDMNCRSIGVEMCSKKDETGKYYIPEDTLTNARLLVKQLMQLYAIPLSGVLRHYDVTGKKCPAPLVDETAWQDYRNSLVAEGNQEPSPWAEEAWEKAKAKGLLDGTRPHDYLTRQELAVVLARLG